MMQTSKRKVMGNLLMFGFFAALVFGLAACQTMSKNREASVDAQLTKTQPPSAPISMADGEPQKGFKQEPAGVPHS